MRIQYSCVEGGMHDFVLSFLHHSDHEISDEVDEEGDESEPEEVTESEGEGCSTYCEGCSTYCLLCSLCMLWCPGQGHAAYAPSQCCVRTRLLQKQCSCVERGIHRLSQHACSTGGCSG